MNILDDLISTLTMKSRVRDIRQGLFHTGVLTKECGMAATLPRDALRLAIFRYPLLPPRRMPWP